MEPIEFKYEGKDNFIFTFNYKFNFEEDMHYVEVMFEDVTFDDEYPYRLALSTDKYGKVRTTFYNLLNVVYMIKLFDLAKYSDIFVFKIAEEFIKSLNFDL